MRSLLLAVFLSSSASAGLVTIADTIKTPMAGTFEGRVQITLNAQFAQPLYNSAGETLSGWQQTITVTGGVFSVQLEANDAITPTGTSYLVNFFPTNGGKPWFEIWTVPTSGSPLKIGTQIRATIVPTSPGMFSPTQLSSGGAIVGQALIYNGNSYAPATIGGGTTYTVSAVINVAAIPDGTCVLDSTGVTLTGAALGGRPTIGSSYQPPAGVSLVPKVTGPNSVKIEICNQSGASYDPASATYYFGVSQ